MPTLTAEMIATALFAYASTLCPQYGRRTVRLAEMVLAETNLFPNAYRKGHPSFGTIKNALAFKYGI